MSKLDYLENQNRELRDQVYQLKQIVKLNKTQIDILSSQLSSQPQSRKLIDVIYRNHKKQEKIQYRLQAAHKEIKQLVTENFMLKQLNQEQTQQLKALQLLNLDSIKTLQTTIKQLQNKIVTLQKFYKEYDKISGFVIKNHHIMTPIDISMELKQKQLQIDNQLQSMLNEVQQARIKEDNLLIVNTILRNKIVSLQAKLAMPNKNLGEILDKSLRRLMIYFIEVQKKIITGEQESQSDEEDDLQLIAPELSGLFPEKQLRIQKDYGVPHLDLLKIRDQLIQGHTKIKDALAARNHLTEKQRIQRLQIQLQYTRRQFSRNLIDLKSEKDRRKKAERILVQLQQRNYFLLNSNKQLQQKVRKYWGKLKQLLISRESTSQLKQNNQILNNDVQSTLILQEPPELYPKNQKSKNPFSINDYPQLDYKIYLELLARQLEDNKKLANIDNLHPKKGFKKMKRSTSDPFLYFNQRKQQILEIKEENEEKNNDRQRLQQTCYHQNIGDQYDENLDGFDV